MSSYDPRILNQLDRDQIQMPLVRRALSDPAFREELARDPAAAIRKHLGVSIPPGVRISVLQETTEQFYLVLPPSLPAASGELRDEELEAVAGGKASQPQTHEPSSGCACFCSATSSAPGTTLGTDCR